MTIEKGDVFLYIIANDYPGSEGEKTLVQVIQKTQGRRSGEILILLDLQTQQQFPFPTKLLPMGSFKAFGHIFTFSFTPNVNL